MDGGREEAGRLPMEFDFSSVNLEYLVQARDLIRSNPHIGAVLLGIPEELAEILAKLSPKGLARLSRVNVPLIAPRLPPWWWSRLLKAAADGNPEELQVVVEHIGLLIES